MSHFYGVVRGGKGEATRGGTKNSGMVSQTASWQGCVEVGLYCEVQEDGSEVDHALVRLKQWHGAGAWPSITLYDGPVSGEGYREQIEEVQRAMRGLDVTEAAP